MKQWCTKCDENRDCRALIFKMIKLKLWRLQNQLSFGLRIFVVIFRRDTCFCIKYLIASFVRRKVHLFIASADQHILTFQRKTFLRFGGADDTRCKVHHQYTISPGVRFAAAALESNIGRVAGWTTRAVCKFASFYGAYLPLSVFNAMLNRSAFAQKSVVIDTVVVIKKQFFALEVSQLFRLKPFE